MQEIKNDWAKKDAEPQRKGEKNVRWQPETQPKGKPPVEKKKGAETTQRLIDANELGVQILGMVMDKMILFGHDAAERSRERFALAMIAQAPTIDAVPISFIEKKIESIRQYLSEHEGEEFMSGLISKAIAYEKLIEEWREENGQTD